jgi:hypothetical protein
LPETFSQVLGDLVDLFRKELRLARAELSSSASAKLRGGIWLGLAGVFGLASVALILGALVAWITSLDVSLHVAFLIVAVGVGLLAIAAYFAGQKDALADLTPSRTISQMKRDIEITKEQLT